MRWFPRLQLTKLNPFNSVFGRMFLWFWLTTLVMIIVTAMVVRHYITSDDLQSIPDDEQRVLDSAAQTLSALPHGRSTGMLRRTLMGLERSERILPLLLRHRDNRIFFRRSVPPEIASRFISLKDATNAYGFFAHQQVFFGPKDVTINDQQYSLFIGRQIRFPMLRSNSGLLLGIAILISGVLCFIFAWQLTKPLKHLRKATQQMASGDLEVRVAQSDSRQDEIGQLSRDFNSMSEKVNRLVSGQKRLLADISHELRSPLARLQLAIGIAQEQPSKDTTDAMLQRIEKEARQIDAMLGQVLQISRLENQTVTPQKEPVSIAALLQPVLDDATYEAGTLRKSLQLSLEATGSIMADQQLLASGIENILRNAVKYARTSISVATFNSGRNIHIRISDDGDGVPESDLGQLFTAFFRVSDARSRNNGGAGLGLAIAKQAISVHNGTISAKNSIEGGLIIDVSLPCY